MARRYARDNKGRFASAGTGATARGGRLRTAAGNKRDTQTAKVSGGKTKSTIAKPKGLKPGAIKAKPQVSSARQAATDRLKVKTQTRRAMRADRGSVVTPGQKSRLEAGKGATIKGVRPSSTVAKPRTSGNAKSQVASRVERKLAAEKTKMNIINRAERVGATQGNQRERSYKRQGTLERAKTFLETGKLPGKDNSIAAQRSMKQARERLAAKNAARQRGDTASVNIPMRGSRGRALDREISRNVAQQKAQKRAADKTRNRQLKSEQSRAKALRNAHVGSIAKAKGLSKSQVENALKAQSPAVQIKALKNWVRDNRKNTKKQSTAVQQSAIQRRQARAAVNFSRASTAQPLPGNRRLTKAQVRSQLRTESAMKIYKGGEAGAKEIRNARGLARTSKAKNNQLQTRAQRVANAQASGNPMITVGGFGKRLRKMR